jgi:hypothetical protein
MVTLSITLVTAACAPQLPLVQRALAMMEKSDKHGYLIYAREWVPIDHLSAQSITKEETHAASAARQKCIETFPYGNDFVDVKAMGETTAQLYAAECMLRAGYYLRNVEIVVTR